MSLRLLATIARGAMKTLNDTESYVLRFLEPTVYYRTGRRKWTMETGSTFRFMSLSGKDAALGENTAFFRPIRVKYSRRTALDLHSKAAASRRAFLMV